MGQSLDDAQVESELEEGDAMDWLVNDELIRRGTSRRVKAEGHKWRKCKVHQDMW